MRTRSSTEGSGYQANVTTVVQKQTLPHYLQLSSTVLIHAQRNHTGISSQARWISSNAPGFTDPLKIAEEGAQPKWPQNHTKWHPHTNIVCNKPVATKPYAHGLEGRNAMNPGHARRPGHARHQNHVREGKRNRKEVTPNGPRQTQIETRYSICCKRMGQKTWTHSKQTSWTRR